MTHITGKVYDLTQENMNKLIEELEEAQKENTLLRELPKYGAVQFLLNQNLELREQRAALTKENAEYKYVQSEIAKRVCPGTTDSVDAVREIVRERDEMREALERIARGTHDPYPTCMTLPSGEFGPPATNGFEGWARSIDETHKAIAREALAALEVGK